MIKIIIITICILVLYSCDTSIRRNRGQTIENQEEISIQERIANMPIFNADSAYYFIERQVMFGHRVPNTEAHRACGDWLIEKMTHFADTVYVQSMQLRAYDGTLLDTRNIIGSFQPENPNRIMLCAHWDTRPWADYDPDPANHFTSFDGANDGGSGVGVLLEIARLLSITQPGVGVDIIFFDAEDYGRHRLSTAPDQDSWALGSQYWSNNPHIVDYNARFGILLDMVGAANATFKHEGYSMMYAPQVVREVWRIARNQGFGQFFINREGGFIIDDHYYVNKIRQLPTINIIDQRDYTIHGFFDYWHTMRDNMEAIDPVILKAVGQTVLAVLWLE